MRTLYFLLILCFFSVAVTAQTPVVMANQPSGTYTENFADIANWSNNFASGIGASAWGSVAVNATGTSGDGIKITTSTAAFTSSTSGGVQKGSGNIVLLSTSTSNSCAIDFYVNFSGVNAGTISFDVAEINNSTGDRDSKLKLFYTLDGVNFIEITGTNLPFTARNSVASSASISVTLPAALNNASGARLRFYEYSTTTGGTPTGSQPKISIDNLVLTASSNSTPCSTPTNQPTGLTISGVSSTSATGSFSAAFPSVNNYLILLSNNQTLTSTPANGVSYAAGDNIDDATVIAVGNSTSFSLSQLSPSTTYWVFVFSLNNMCTGGPLYLQTNPLSASFTTSSGILPCISPVNQPSTLSFPAIAASGVQALFRSSADADEYLAIRSSAAQLSRNPVNGTSYVVGDTLGGGIVVSTGSDTTFVDDSLSASTTYYYTIFALNSQNCSNGPIYLITNPLKGSVTSASLGGPCVAPTAQPTSLTLSATNTNVSGSFTASSSADSYLILYSTSSSLTQLPVNNTNYAPGATLGNAIVVSNSSSSSFYQNSLSASTRYYFYVFAENSTCTGGTKYYTTSPLTQNITTSSASTYNYYYGNLHAHSGYSDGNKDNTSYTPANDYAYAKNSLHMDFLGISEHNHSGAGMSLSSWPLGVAQAQAATTSSFLALYGQEWGVISGGGHVLIYGIDSLIGWETNNYQIYVAKSDYTGPDGLFKRLNKNGNAFASYAHPSGSDYNSISSAAYSSSVDSCMIGSAVESGPAFATNVTYDSFPTSMSYLSYYTTMLGKGYHIGPFMDHDTHYTNFGRANEIRTVVLAPSLTKANLFDAFKGRHFYATEDFDTKITFTLNNEIMGTVLSGNTSPSINVTVTDPTAPTSATKSIKLMYGVPGSGKSATQLTSSTSTTLSYTHTALATGSSAYYYLDVTINGRRSITAPIWYTKTNTVSSPSLTVGSLTGFGKQLLNTTSTEKSFTVSGTSLLGNVTLSAPSGFLISSTSGSGFGTSLTLTPSSGTLASTNIYVKFNPTGLKIYTGNITCSSSSATTQNIAVSGTAYIVATACNSYSWNGTTYTTSGDKTYTTIGSGGLDSTATLQLTINNSTTSTQTVSACTSYSWNGTTYTTSGSKTWTGTNAAGCDSVATLNLTIKQPSTSTSNLSACTSYTWNGTTYSASGTYTKSLTNAAGCDSTATLNLTIKQATSSTESASSCSSYVWRGTTYTTSGAKTWTTTNAAGCDSVITLNLIIKQKSTSTQTVSVCGSYLWNGTTYTTSGTKTWTGTNAVGCDSVAILNLTINTSVSSNNSVSSCNSSYTWNGQTYTSSGTYTYNTTSVSGCDSTATLNLVLKRTSSSNSSATACDSYLWNGQTYTSSGTYTYTTLNAAGCDSVATLNLTINPLPSVTVTNSNNQICSGSNATFNLNGTVGAIVTYNINGGVTSTITLTNGSASVSISNATSTQILNLISVSNSSTNCSKNLTASSSITIKTSTSDVYWNFTTASPVQSQNITVSDLSQGNNSGTVSLLNSSVQSSGYTGASGGNNANLNARIGSLNTAANGSGYFSFNVTAPNSGNFLLNGISFGSYCTSTGPQSYIIRSSADNYSSNIDSGSLSNNSSWSLKSKTGINFSGSNTTFRIYGFNGSGDTSTTAPTTSKIAGWNFFGQSSPVTFAATTFNANLISTNGLSNITRGDSASSSSGSNSFRTTGFKNNGISISSKDYFQVKLTAASNYKVSLSKINAKMVGTASFYASPGVTSQYAYSFDSINFTLIGSPVTTTSLTSSIDVSAISALQNVSAGTTIYIRYYASGQTATGGWGFASANASDTSNGLEFMGSVALSNSSTSNWRIDDLNLTFTSNNTASSSTETVTACSSYTWHGTTYTTSNNSATWIGTNAAGCDSVVTLNLTIKQVTSSAISAAACGTYTWNGTTYTTSGVKTWTGTNAAGCDSVVTLNLTIKQATSSTISATACGSYSWNGTTYTTSGIKTWTGTNAAGCDSVVTLNLTIKQVTSSTTSASACVSYTWNGTTYTTSGIKTWTGINANGCDSVVTLNLTIKNTSSSTENISSCESYTWHETTYLTSTTTTWTGTNAIGCDSIVTLNLTIKNPSTYFQEVSACDSFNWKGTTYYQSTNTGTIINNMVSAKQDLLNAFAAAMPGDTIVVANGKYNWGNIVLSNTNGNSTSSWIVLKAQSLNGVTFVGNTYLQFSGNRIHISGFKFSGGNAGTNAVVAFRSSSSTFANYSRVSNISVDNYNPPVAETENEWVAFYGVNNRLDHCSFINKSNARATVVVWYSAATFPDKSISTYHRIDSNYFLGRSYMGGNGGETIRVGVGNNSRTDGYNLIEYNVFENCTQTEPEIISNKSAHNTYRYNTFKNCNGGLTLRMGKYCDVYGNSFIVNDATKTESYGIRIIDKGHRVFNNYLEGLLGSSSNLGDMRTPIVIYNGFYPSSDSLNPAILNGTYIPADDAIVAFNSIINCKGGSGLNIGFTDNGDNTYVPSGLIIANNVIKMSTGQAVYIDPANTSLSISKEGNIYNAPSGLGLSSSTGFTSATISLSSRSNGIISPTSTSIQDKAVNSSSYTSMINSLDLQGQTRSTVYDVGCDELNGSGTVLYKPLDSSIVGAGKTIFLNQNSLTSILPKWVGTNSIGCDSIVYLNLTIKPKTTSSSSLSSCGSYTWNGTTYTTSGIKTWTGANAAGCDSTATLNLTIKLATSSTSSASVCGSYSWNGTTYTTSGAKIWTGTNTAGCDSVATLNLTIKQTTSSTSSASACGSYTWNGTTYTSSGTKTWTGTNAAGCDSVATLNLTIKQATVSNSSASACGSYTWNGTTYTSSGTKTWTGTNAAGCDSVATLNLTIKQATSSTSSASACGSYTWNGTTYTTSGAKTWTGTNAAGCDSVATLNLTIKQTTSSTSSASACGSYTWNGTTYTSSGTKTWTGTNAAGCDSVATLNLTIKQATSSNTSVSACGSYTWNGNTYTTSGMITWSGMNAAGCDSTASLNLTIKQSSSSNQYLTISSNSLPFVWNGLTCNASGSYSVTLTNAAGCDSTVNLQLTVNMENVNSTLNLKLYLEGMYNEGGLMSSSLYNLGISNQEELVDSIQVDLWKPTHLGNNLPDYSNSAILYANGNALVEFPSSIIGNSYFIAIRHRNAVETWSSNAVSFFQNNVYDFTDSQNKVFTDGINPAMRQVANGKYAFFSGDINHDGTVDALDLQVAENDAFFFAFGYNSSDCNGDGASDAIDMQIIENNATKFIFYARPY